MRGKPLDLAVLCRKIAVVRYDGPYLHSMKKGWMDIWKSEWLFLIKELSSYLDNNPNDALAANLVRKLSGGHNALYITRAEHPWLIKFIGWGDTPEIIAARAEVAAANLAYLASRANVTK